MPDSFPNITYLGLSLRSKCGWSALDTSIAGFSSRAGCQANCTALRTILLAQFDQKGKVSLWRGSVQNVWPASKNQLPSRLKMLMKCQGCMATILLVLYSDVMDTWDKGMKVFSRCRNQQLTAFLTEKKRQIRFSEPKEEGAVRVTKMNTNCGKN